MQNEQPQTQPVLSQAQPEVRYERFAPSPQLERYVEHFWMVSAPGERAPNGGLKARREILIPNGRPMLLLSFANPSVRIDPFSGERLPNGNQLFGIATRPFVIEQVGESGYIGVQFRPYGLTAFTHGERLADQAMSLEAWLGQAEAEALVRSLLEVDFGPARVAAPAPLLGSAAAMAAALDRCLCSFAADVDPAGLRLPGAAVERIDAAGGQVTVAELADELHVHAATFYRLFKQATGIAPKVYIDIMRFYTLVGRMLEGPPGDSAALLAALEGYYDQAHALKAFRRFSGVTPGTFRTTLNNIARLMQQG